jgi:hypothetical protein
MALEAIIFLFLEIGILALVIASVFLIWKFYNTDKKINTLLEKGKIKDFKDIFLSQKEKNNKLDEKIKEAFLKIKNLEDISEKTIQKTGIVRFNPFNNMGGNQSFVIALLDDNNNGFVISSLFVKEGNRVYAKGVKNGKSDHKLSQEEKEAIEKACLPVGRL